jgi:hypothetical protein
MIATVTRPGSSATPRRPGATLGPTDVVYLGVPPVRVDILCQADGIDAEQVLDRAITVMLGELAIPRHRARGFDHEQAGRRQTSGPRGRGLARTRRAALSPRTLVADCSGASTGKGIRAVADRCVTRRVSPARALEGVADLRADLLGELTRRAQRRRGRASNHRLPVSLRASVLEVVRGRYADFGPTLAVRSWSSSDSGVFLASKPPMHSHLRCAGPSRRQAAAADTLRQRRCGDHPRRDRVKQAAAPWIAARPSGGARSSPAQFVVRRSVLERSN